MAKEEKSISVKSARLLSSLYAGQMLGILIIAATFIVVTRLLGPGNYGLYTFAFGFSALIDAVGNFGMGSYFSSHLARFSYKKDPKQIMKTLISGYAVLFPITISLSLFGIGISWYMANFVFTKIGIAPLTLMLVSSTIFFITAVSTSTQALIGFSRGRLASFVTLLVDIIQLASCSTLILLGFGLNGAITGMLIGYMVGAVLSVYLAFKVAGEYGEVAPSPPTRREYLSALRYTAPLAANNVLNLSVQNFAILYLGFYVTSSVLGNYGAALRGLSFIAISYFTMSTALLPIFTTAKAAKKRSEINSTYNRILFYSILFTLPAIIYVGVLSKPGVHLLLSNNYGTTALYLSLLAFGTVLDLLQYYIASLIMSRGFTRTILRYNSVSIIIQFISVILLVPILGVLGAIASIYFIGGVIDDILAVKMARDLIHMRLEYRRLLGLFAVNLALALPISLALLTGHAVLELLLGLLAVLVFYPILLVFSRMINIQDIEFVRKTAEKVSALRRPADLIIRYTLFLMRLRGVPNG